MAKTIRQWFKRLFASSSTNRQRAVRPRLETLEDRECPAIFNVGVTSPGVGNVAALIAAFNQANVNNVSDVINLAANATYTLTSVNNSNTPEGNNGLPIIGPDNSATPTLPANPITINGNGATITRAATAPDFRIFDINGGRLIINSLTISGGITTTATGFGGGIRVTDSTGVNGGLSNLILRDSLVTNNVSAFGDGGGIAIVAGGKAVITNSTIDGNTALNLGGGITQLDTGILTVLTNCTIADNVAENGNNVAVAGGGINVEGGVMNINNTIVTRNHRTTAAGPEDDLTAIAGGGTVNARKSLFRATPTGVGINGVNQANIIGQFPLLGPLQNNGGLTETLAIASPLSPAINAGSNALIEGTGNGADAVTDQRGPGFNRIIGGTVDIGAYEYQPPAVLVTLASSPNPSVFGAPATFTAQVAGVAVNSNVPQGTVTFVVDGVAIGVAALINGVATFSTSALGVGDHEVLAEYNPITIGNYGFNAGDSTALLQEVLAPNIPPIGRRWNR